MKKIVFLENTKQLFSRMGKALFTGKKGKKLILIAAIFILGIILIKQDYFSHIPPGQRGILFNRFGGGVSNNILPEGSHFVFPGLQTVYHAKVSRQSAHIERITADSKEFQDVALWLNVEFQIIEESLPDLFREFGVMSSREIIDQYIIPNTNEVTKNIMVGYGIADILDSQPAIKAEITKKLQFVLKEYHITVIDVDIENIRLDPAFKKVIADIEFADFSRQNEALKMEIAKKDADRRILEAETLKREKILLAEAEAQYNAILNAQQISPALLEFKRLENNRLALERWNGQFPASMGDVHSWPF